MKTTKGKLRNTAQYFCKVCKNYNSMFHYCTFFDEYYTEKEFEEDCKAFKSFNSLSDDFESFNESD